LEDSQLFYVENKKLNSNDQQYNQQQQQYQPSSVKLQSFEHRYEA
jgi:hypothetical protein